ncbi:hypothetical protein Naga_100986g1 [Nannochloropsis gaditana]|uniref:Uncharacterized protein n=1 Tax=Nannochloropsis gaditana TaxID=72520 RepID=W7TB79_9STRA|nr:hypothetical protein Naga_100986g1 [Nannochloropsis gaditana]
MSPISDPSQKEVNSQPTFSRQADPQRVAFTLTWTFGRKPTAVPRPGGGGGLLGPFRRQPYLVLPSFLWPNCRSPSVRGRSSGYSLHLHHQHPVHDTFLPRRLPPVLLLLVFLRPGLLGHHGHSLPPPKRVRGSRQGHRKDVSSQSQPQRPPPSVTDHSGPWFFLLRFPPLAFRGLLRRMCDVPRPSRPPGVRCRWLGPLSQPLPTRALPQSDIPPGTRRRSRAGMGGRERGREN